MVSRTGATLTSSGHCGGSTVNFTTTSAGFEYLRIDTSDPLGYKYGAWTEQAQRASWKYQLPHRPHRHQGSSPVLSRGGLIGGCRNS